jgi:hypothetical protein
MTTARSLPSATLLANGQVLIAGGDSISGGNGTLASAELYDPHAFAPTGNMAWRRVWHKLNWLPDGRVLAAGGGAELYTPDVLVRAPALVPVSGDGHGQGSIFHAGTTHIAAAEDPARATSTALLTRRAA